MIELRQTTGTAQVHVAMATNRQVRERIAAHQGGPATGLVERLLQRQAESAEEACASAAGAPTVDVTSGDEDVAPSQGSNMQFGNSPTITRLGGRANDEEDETTAVDYEPSPSDVEEGEFDEVTTIRGTEEEWRALRESRAQLSPIELHELERNPSSANVSAFRTEEEVDALRAVNAREPVVVTNHETGLEPIAVRQHTHGLPIMPPPEQWPAGNAPKNLLAKARLAFADYDRSFHAWREKKLRDASGAKRVHPIPVLLFTGETEEQYEAAFIASLRRVGPDGTVREVSTDPQGERSQRLQFALGRMSEYRAHEGLLPPQRAAPMRAARKRSTVDANRSPPPAPQRLQLGRERPQVVARQAPMSSAQGYSLSTSPSSGVDLAGASRLATAPRGSVARRDDQSAVPAALAGAALAHVAAFGSHDVLATMILQSSRAIGALEGELASLRQHYDQQLSALSQKCEELEADVHRLKTSAADEHSRAKAFHARYAPRVKALWQNQSVLDVCAGVQDDQRFGDWDNDPQ